jgi:hypothetical protein
MSQELIFNKSFVPVLNDASFRIMFIAKFVWTMTSAAVDNETAFHHGDFDEEIYIEAPNGLTIGA